MGLAFCSVLLVAGCWRPEGIGIGGRYIDAKLEINNTQGNLNKAIAKLEYIARHEPTYKDSLTLLARAYYNKRRYRDAFEILKRALAVNPEDEIAWITLGLTQLRLGDDKGGLESFKGGIQLLSKVSKDGYRGLEWWDKKQLIRSTIQKAVFFSSKGIQEKRRIIRIGEILLARIDDEEYIGDQERFTEERVP